MSFHQNEPALFLLELFQRDETAILAIEQQQRFYRAFSKFSVQRKVWSQNSWKPADDKGEKSHIFHSSPLSVDVVPYLLCPQWC